MFISKRGIHIKKYTLEVLTFGLMIVIGTWFLGERYNFPREFGIILSFVGFVLIIGSTLKIIKRLGLI